ncbi:hypothetical protein [Alkalihalobacillus pseudalcaliphilus]|nr:hypothetical protein [Alkalihalobacillus pseudalcaliphilus]
MKVYLGAMVCALKLTGHPSGDYDLTGHCSLFVRATPHGDGVV